MKFQKINGLIAATFTPINSQGNLDLSQIQDYAWLLKANHIKGAFINGTTGEGASLTFAEKKELIDAWAPFNSEEFKIIAMVAGTSQKEGKELASYCQEKGLYGISVNAPYYIKPNSVESLTEFFKPIAEAAPELAFYYYHIPLLSQVDLPMLPLLESAGESISNFAGIKYTHTDLMEFNQCLRYKNGKFDILWGWDEMLLAGLAMGAVGGVGSTYNYAAPLYYQLIHEFQQGNLDKALALQEKSIDVISLYPKFGGAVTGKAILSQLGIECGNFRSPGNSISQKKKAELLQELERCNFFEFCMQPYHKQ
ncbi:dihydrodipicolinate synthase family protein [Algoriphagus mannitolivorans]|uniref:dihydrodipicolinate synthase family protein n=1 Tax=Algoriphagus mannitolivorans TaxID=226504 RepID=UPI00047B0830|nr:dihydrodipicolinate synthase family protein [Algoriphagus mannitolivorans]